MENSKTLEKTREEIKKNKKLLSLEPLVIITCFSIPISFLLIIPFIAVTKFITIVLICITFISLIASVLICMKIEHKAGYYQCTNCRYYHIPSLKNIIFSDFVKKTRDLNCPNCNKHTWHFKKLTKDSYLLPDEEQFSLLEYEKRINSKHIQY